MHSPWSHVTTANNDPPLWNIVPGHDLLAGEPAVPMWLNSACDDVTCRRSQRSLLDTNVGATADQPALRMHRATLFFLLPQCDGPVYA